MKKRRLSWLLALYLVLGTWKGYIALFEKGEAEPCQIFPNQLSALPPEDQAALEKGIIIRSEQQLQSLLEDYLS